MLLQKLREYADRAPAPLPRLYREKPVRYIIELDEQGKPLNRAPTDTADPTNRATRRGARRAAPEVQRSFGIRPLLLADKADYVLGMSEDGAAASRVRRAEKCHAAFVEQAKRCYEETKAGPVRAILAFLESHRFDQLDLPGDFDLGATITFRVEGAFPIDLPEVQGFWAQENAASDEQLMQCVSCGERKPVLERLQEKIKGVPGGQTSGTALISANEEAFESYGLPASLVAPTCTDCAEGFTRGLNELLAGEQTSIRVGSQVAFVFWTREESDYSFRSLLTDPQPGEVRELINSARSGRRTTTDPSPFYCISISGSGGRAVIRDWLDVTVGHFNRSLARWFEHQQVVSHKGGEEGAPLGLWRLARATVRDPADISPNVPRALLRSALTGSPLPHVILFEAVKRNKAEQRVTRERAALIKLVMLSRGTSGKEDFMVQLDTENEDPAYLCGRLLAVLGEVQRAALPGAGTKIVDRFYGTASTAPASVFGRLVRGAQPHLGKLERDKRGAYIALQRLLEDVMSRLEGFPWTLALEEQGRFALGYYHQRAAGWGKRAKNTDDGEEK